MWPTDVQWDDIILQLSSGGNIVWTACERCPARDARPHRSGAVIIGCHVRPLAMSKRRSCRSRPGRFCGSWTHERR